MRRDPNFFFGIMRILLCLAKTDCIIKAEAREGESFGKRLTGRAADAKKESMRGSEEPQKPLRAAFQKGIS